MKSAAALATLFAVGALSIPSAHNHHEHLHRRHAEAEAQVYTETDVQTATNVVMQYVDQNGNPVAAPAGQTPAPAAPAPAPPANYGNNQPAGGNSQFATVVTADNGQSVTAEAWQWGSPNGRHGYSWTYQMPGGNQQPTAQPQPQQPASQAPASQAPASYQPASQAPAKSSQAPASSPAAAPSSSSTASGASGSWQQSIVDAHNVHRANHSVPNIAWHGGLAQAAQMVANKCSFTHDLDTGKDICGFPSYGQNFACVGGDASEDPSKDISGMWYGEEGIFAQSNSYGLPNPNPTSEETGHFTQVVWKTSTHVGCAVANCPGGVSGTSGMDSLFVCDYGPEGNMGGEYADNVPRPLGQPPSQGTSY